MSRFRSWSWDNRMSSLVVVLVMAAVIRLALPAVGQRAAAAVLVAVTLGYAHLLGAAIAAWPRTRALAPEGTHAGVWLATLLTGVLTLFAAYTVVAASGLVLFVLVAVSVWHSFENDFALEEFHAPSRRRNPRISRLDHHLVALGAAALAMAAVQASVHPLEHLLVAGSELAALGSPTLGTAVRSTAALVGLVLLLGSDGARRAAGAAYALLAVAMPWDLFRWISAPELVAYCLLYHLASWVLLVGRRIHLVRVAGDAAMAWRMSISIGTLHFVVFGVCVGLLILPFTQLRWTVLSPSFYLFWAALHVAHTTWLRIAGAGRVRSLRFAVRGRVG